MASGMYEAPAMERSAFRSWDDFFSFMEEYQQRTGQTFSRRSATSVKTRNQVLASIAATGRPLPSPLLPESFLDYSRTLQCSHKLRGEAAKASARWNGVQPSECQARVNATLQLCEDGTYSIRVTKVYLVHNHPLGETASAVGNATAEDAASLSFEIAETTTGSLVAKHRRVGRPRKYPRPGEELETAVNPAARQNAAEVLHVPTMADVKVFLARVERSRSHLRGQLNSVEERLASYVNEFAAQDGNAAKIFVDDEKVLSSITLQTKHMRKVFEAFPEVLRVDAIPSPKEESSESNYRVFSLIAHDTLGNWQYVQHAIVESDRSETLRAALDQFKANNARHPRIRALILPHGDSLELQELRASFPAARVLYSQFHVVRALHQAISAHGHDLTSWHRDRLTGIAQLLVYAPTSLVYGTNVAAMVEVLGSKQHPFFCYFLEKWDSCRDRWATFAREGVATFTVSENDDRFAPTWRAIFAAVNNEMALDEIVAALRYYQAVVERAFIRDLKREANKFSNSASHVGTSNDNDYDAEMRLLAATVSPAASSLIFPQYRFAISRGAYQFCEPSRGSFFVSAVAPNDIFCDEPSKEFCVETDRGWRCSCAFMVNHHLPCRHVFYIRRIVRCSCVIPMEHIEPRWVLAKAAHFFDPPQSSTEATSGEDSLEEASNQERLNVVSLPGSWQKYVTAQEIGKRISQRMMEMAPEEFSRALDFYKLVETTLNVRPFNLHSAAVARFHSQARAPAVAKPNWVEPDPSRTLAPRGGPPVAGTMYVSAGDHIAAAIAARNRQQAQLASRPAAVPAKRKTSDVIDLLDESEEEEKRNDVQQKATGADEATTSSVGEHGTEPEVESGAEKENSSSTQPANGKEPGADNNISNTEAEVAQQDTEASKEKEPWEAIDNVDQSAASTSAPQSPSFSS